MRLPQMIVLISAVAACDSPTDTHTPTRRSGTARSADALSPSHIASAAHLVERQRALEARILAHYDPASRAVVARLLAGGGQLTTTGRPEVQPLLDSLYAARAARTVPGRRVRPVVVAVAREPLERNAPAVVMRRAEGTEYIVLAPDRVTVPALRAAFVTLQRMRAADRPGAARDRKALVMHELTPSWWSDRQEARARRDLSSLAAAPEESVPGFGSLRTLVVPLK